MARFSFDGVRRQVLTPAPQKKDRPGARYDLQPFSRADRKSVPIPGVKGASDVNHNFSHTYRREIMKNLAINAAWGFAAGFLGAAAMGFVPNPLLGRSGLFVTNTAHNLVHLATAIAFGAVALLGERASIRFMQAFGVVYLLTGVLGFVMLGSHAEGDLLHVVHINGLDNFLHLGLGIAIATAGWVARRHANRRMVAAQA
jgi:hypothetical protein